MTTEPFVITDNLDQLLAVLPDGLAEKIAPEDRAALVEIVMDLGRQPEARYTGRFTFLRDAPITREDLDYVEARLGEFGDDNRAGIPATLHRISAMRNRRGSIVGLTLRVGRAVMGIVDILRDIIESGESVLLMGRPGLGKTTLLREMARVSADELNKRVVIVDTSNEIAGDGDVPHPAIGRARRMQVPRVEKQHDVMIEAVENHMPEVIVIDEIGRIEETLAARTIAERGVQLVATVHGNTLDNLLANPTMSDLVGGVQAVTLSDEEARRRRTQKTVLERKAPPTFSVVVEMIERDKIAVRRPVSDVVDGLLRGLSAPPELRWRDEEGVVHSAQAAPSEVSRPRHDFEMRGEYGGHANGQGGQGGQGGPGGQGGRGRRREAAPSRWGKERGPARPERARNHAALEDVGYSGRSKKYDFLQALPHELPPATRPYPDSNPQLNGAEAEVSDVEADADDFDEPEIEEGEEGTPSQQVDAPVDVSRVRRVYPFGVSRSRLARAIKHLGLPLTVTRTWHDADAVLLLAGADGLAPSSSLLREAREAGLALIEVHGNTYAHILSRLNDLFSGPIHEGRLTQRELALQEARTAVERVVSDGEPVELRPQAKTLRRLQHQLAQRFHVRSYSIGREPHRRVRFLPSLGR